MTAPALDAQRFGWALALGAGLGLVYGFLRWLRPRALGDLLFVGAAFYGWLVLSFGICQGDIRFGYSLGLLLGGFLEEATLGRLLRPVFKWFWWQIWKILGIFFWPFRKFYIIFKKFCNFLLAGAKKWVTIERESVGADADPSGGVTHGKQAPHQDGPSQEPSADPGRSAGGRCFVHRRTADPARRCESR